MITGRQAVSLAEAKEMLSKDQEGQEELRDYMKKFTKLSADKAKELIEEINGLGNVKIKNDDAVKVADFLPKDAESLSKIFADASLSEEEVNAILEIVKKY